MATLAQLQAQLAAIEAAYASGVLVVRHGDTQTTFRSLKEMSEIIAKLKAEIAAANGTQRRGPRYIKQTGKGL